MKVQVNVDRTAAIMAGHDTYGPVIVDLDPADLTPEERALLAECPESNGITNLTATPEGYATHRPPYPKTTTPEPRLWLAWRAETKAAHAAHVAEVARRAEERMADYLEWAKDQPLEAFIATSHHRVDGTLAPAFTARLPPAETGASGSHFLPSSSDWRHTTTAKETNTPAPEVYARQRLAERFAEAETRVAVLREESARAIANQRAETEAAAERRERQLADEVRDFMDDNALGRYRMGVLPEEEILDSMRARIFAPLEGLPRYRKLHLADLEHEDGCYSWTAEATDGDSLTCEVERATDMTSAEAERFWAIDEVARAIALTGLTVEVTPLAHRCSCDHCHAEAIRLSAQVKVTVGELTFTREYGLEDPCQ
jgi:hypothetical protein